MLRDNKTKNTYFISCSVMRLLASVACCVGNRSWPVELFQWHLKRSNIEAVWIVIRQSKALGFAHKVAKMTPQWVQNLFVMERGSRVIPGFRSCSTVIAMQKCCSMQSSIKTGEFKQGNCKQDLVQPDIADNKGASPQADVTSQGAPLGGLTPNSFRNTRSCHGGHKTEFV